MELWLPSWPIGTLDAWRTLSGVKPRSWERHGLRAWIQSASRRLHHNVLVVASIHDVCNMSGQRVIPDRSFQDLVYEYTPYAACFFP